MEVAFQQLPMADIMALAKVVHNEPDMLPSKEEASQEPCPTFGPNPTPKQQTVISKKKKRIFPSSLIGRCSFRQRTPGQIYQFDL